MFNTKKFGVHRYTPQSIADDRYQREINVLFCIKNLNYFDSHLCALLKKEVVVNKTLLFLSKALAAKWLLLISLYFQYFGHNFQCGLCWIHERKNWRLPSWFRWTSSCSWRWLSSYIWSGFFYKLTESPGPANNSNIHHPFKFYCFWDTKLSWNYIGQKFMECTFSNLGEKKYAILTKKLACTKVRSF